MHLRKKIEMPDAPERLLRTESGIGYRLVMPTHKS
jgi:DNA-binding response OmpR family regulator